MHEELGTRKFAGHFLSVRAQANAIVTTSPNNKKRQRISGLMVVSGKLPTYPTLPYPTLLFGPEIDAQSISIPTVRDKICLDPILCNEDAKKVYDKIRAQWRYKAQVDKPSTASLPSEKETVSDRVDRMFKESNTHEDDEESFDSSDVISPTKNTGTSKPGVFSPINVQTLLRLFSAVINGSPISKPNNTKIVKRQRG